MTPEDVQVIRATKIATVTADVVKWVRVNSKSKIPVFRWITFKLTPYGKQQEAAWKQNMQPPKPRPLPMR